MALGSKILNRYSFDSTPAKVKINKILTLLKDKQQCSLDISEAIHVSKSCVKCYIKYLLQEKLIYIDSWVLCTKGKRTMFYAFYKTGNLRNKTKPKPLTEAQKSKRFRNKMKKDIDRIDLANAKRRIKRYKIQPADSWMKV